MRPRNRRTSGERRRANHEAALARLFPDCPREALHAGAEPWPALEGVLAILVTSRSGSTFLAREIESRFRIGQIGESFNPPQLKSRAERAGGLASPAEAARHAVAALSESGWFGVKMGAQALECVARMGFVEAYRDRMHVLLLFRRDLVAQAVSSVKAEITGRFHSAQKETRAATPGDYAHERILARARTILGAMETLDQWVRGSGRPWRRVFYEDFAGGDFSGIETACEGLGLAKRAEPHRVAARAVARIGDDLNAQWSRRFRDEPSGEAREVLEEYERLMRS